MAKGEFYWNCDCSFPDHWKHGELARIINVSLNEAVGIVVRLFSRVRRLADDGALARVPDSAIQHWTNSRKVTKEALVLAGWLDPDFKVHEWDIRYGDLALKRLANKEKKRLAREAKLRNVPFLSPKKEDVSNFVPQLSHPHNENENENDKKKEEKTADKPPVLLVEVKPPKKKRKSPGDLVDPATIDPDLARIWFAHVESTGRKVGGAYVLTQRRVTTLGRLVEWASGADAAERGVRALGASAWHRENKRDSLEDAPFRTREAFTKWVGDDRDPRAAPHLSLTYGSSPPPERRALSADERAAKIAEEEAAVAEAKTWLAEAKTDGERKLAKASVLEHESTLRSLCEQAGAA